MQLTRLIAFSLAVATFAAEWPSHAEDETNPFVTTPAIISSNGTSTLTVAFRIPAHHRLYFDALSFEVDGESVNFSLPEPETISDKHSGATKRIFATNFIASFPLGARTLTSLAVNLHGCNDEECFFPETRRWTMLANRSFASADVASTSSSPATKLSDGFAVVARTSGFQNSDNFVEFLGQSDQASSSGSPFAGLGITATVGLILLGGLALNLTPCVLPMIPINLAILGAGTGRTNRRRGFALGGAYGVGMAVAYGGLGLLVVLTGARFGTLNSSPWFNFAIAAVFVVLGLAMMDRLAIDFSRFQTAGARRRPGGAVLGAALMGSVSALLAGACVAPVVISVLLLATTLYQQGNVLGLLLPFVLGAGMALPWPFAAAGLSVLPKPGAWMTRVKQVFAVFIFGFALWYVALGWSLLRPLSVSARNEANGAKDNIMQLRAALQDARANGRPVLVDFWASWCKNCAAMEHTTLRDAAVRDRLKQFTVVRFQAEHLNDEAIKPVLDEFGVMGLPTFVVLKPNVPTASAQSESQNNRL